MFTADRGKLSAAVTTSKGSFTKCLLKGTENSTPNNYTSVIHSCVALCVSLSHTHTKMWQSSRCKSSCICWNQGGWSHKDCLVPKVSNKKIKNFLSCQITNSNPLLIWNMTSAFSCSFSLGMSLIRFLCAFNKLLTVLSLVLSCA